MSRRYIYFILGCALALVVALLLPSFTARAVFAGLVLIVALVFTYTSLRKSNSIQALDRASDESSAPERFAFSKLFEATMGGMREGLVVVDNDMRVVASNTAAHRLFNLSRGELNGQRLTDLSRNPAIYSAFLDGLKGSERSGIKVKTHGTEPLVFDLRVVPLGSANGKSKDGTQVIEGALGVFIDVTRLEQLEQIRQEFLSNVSHELRTPLTAILAFVETLESGAIEDKEASRRFLPIIRKNASRMQDLIDDILELSAIEAGNVQVKAERLDLHPLVNDVISSLAAKAESRGVTVTNAVSLEAQVFADARKLEQMLTNLVENAIKFNRQNGAVTIRHETHLSDGDNRKATGGRSSSVAGRVDRIIVEDTGEGIPVQHLARLFERFYRVDRARSRELGGTGLGLAIVKHLAMAHNGEVTVTSELGKGSTFRIELPTTN